MKRVQCGLTAGVALVGAGVIAVAPVAPPAATARSVTWPVAMTASYTEAPPELLALSAQRIVEGLAAAPLNPLIMAVAIAGNDRELLYAALRQSIDGPLWAADPALEALADILPAQLGGGSGNESTTADGDGTLLQFRNDVLWSAGAQARNFVADVLEVPSTIDANPAAILATGFASSATNLATGLALAPLGLIPIAEAIATGEEADLYRVIRQYIDAPLWVADPSIEAVARVLPESLGGGTDRQPEVVGPEDGALVQFRNDVLWQATAQTRTVVADALGVDPNLNTSETEAVGLTAGTERKTSNRPLPQRLSSVAPESNTAGVPKSKPRPVRAAVTSINKQLQSTSDRIDRTVKRLTTPKSKKKNDTGGATESETSEKSETTED